MQRMTTLTAAALMALTGLAAAQPSDGPKRGDRPSGDRPATRERLIERFDTDGDGVLNDAEKDAAREAVRARRGGDGRGEGRPGNTGEQGRGRAQMPPQLQAMIVEHFDIDGDGELNADEHEAARADIREHLDALRKEFIAEHDTDGDGTLSRDEHRAAREVVRAEMQARKADAIANFDADEDGKLNREEREAAFQAEVDAWKEAHPGELPYRMIAAAMRRGERGPEGTAGVGSGRRPGPGEDRPGFGPGRGDRRGPGGSGGPDGAPGGGPLEDPDF